uniref:Tetratricopeptide SHNi-TPR domain-containing protein n=1 Tax=Schistocephalus solidus TaxID=70667 RepID=A0A0X3PZH4_SCHSO
MAPLDGAEVEKPADCALTADELIAKGKRDLICLEISSAVDNFQKACQLIAAEHGDFHESLAAPNLLYGTALLELARSENNILSEAVGNAESDASDSEVEEDTEDQLSEARDPPEILTEEANGDRQTETAGDTDKGKDDVPPVGNVVKKSTEDAPIANGEVTNNSSAAHVESDASELSCAAANDPLENKEGDEDVSTLQLAWEVVEVAKALFRKHNDSEHQLKVADCLEKLAEISCEKEDHEQAINDLLECLEIRMKYAGENDRLIAETHFQLGVTYSLLNNAHSSNASFATSLDYLNKHRSKLVASFEAQETETDSGKADAHRLELQIKEITQLIKEVEERQKENSDTSACKEFKRDIAPLEPLTDVPTSDVTHLIKKKRPIEASEGDLKKPKLEVTELDSANTASVV